MNMEQIDYKEKYEQALERARQFSEKPYLEDSAGIVEYIFPELKESEDESIRKALMQNLKERFGTKGNMGEGLDMPDVLAWLEKQGEQKPNYCHHEVNLSDCSEEYLKAYYDGWINCNMQHSQCRSELDNVVKCIINGMKFYYEDNEEATWGTDKWSMPVKHIIEVLEKQSKDSPVLFNSSNTGKYSWSEEDVAMIKTLVAIFEVNYSNGFYKVNPIGTTNMQGIHSSEIIKWLKSLKDRVLPQPKQEWSEEDEEMFDAVIADIQFTQKAHNHDVNQVVYEREIDWLKSIRPQPNYIQTKTDNRIRLEIIKYLDCQKREEPTRKEKHDEWIEWLISKGKLPITMQQDNNWIERIEDILDWAEEKGRLSLSDCQDYSIMLSSLKHKSQWKTSDEQIKVCKEVYADILSAKGFDLGTINSELNRLEEQLKKLTE